MLDPGVLADTWSYLMLYICKWQADYPTAFAVKFGDGVLMSGRALLALLRCSRRHQVLVEG